LIRNYEKAIVDSEEVFQTKSYTAAGFRYGLTTMKLIFFKNSQVQDSLSPELGLYLYKSLQSANDTYTVMPVLATMRYNLTFGDSLTLFGYAGLLKNFVIMAFQPDGETLKNLNSFFPAIGAGLLFRVGPNWDTRVDFGTDVLSVGLVLRF
jgi:hypothetical protein